MDVRESVRAGDADHEASASKPAAGPSVDPTLARIVELQRTAGNAAVGRMLARLAGDATTTPPRPPARRPRVLSRYEDPGITAAVGAFTGAISDDQRSALELLDREHGSISGPWSKLAWADVAKGVADRVLHPDHIQQNPLGLCGPAAVANYMAAVTPGTYAYDVMSIFEDGAWGSDKVNSKLLGNAAMTGMDPADWLLLSTMQDVTNYMLDYDGRTALLAEGQFASQVENTMTRFTKISKTTTYDCRLWGVKEQSQKVSDLLRTHGDQVCVVMFVDSTRLQNEARSGSRDHFIRLLEPIKYGPDTVEFKIFTWGGNRTMTFTTPHFESLVYNYIVGGVGAVDL